MAIVRSFLNVSLSLGGNSSPGLILREVYINDPATDTAWTNALVFSMIMDLLPCVEFDDIQASELLPIANATIKGLQALMRCSDR
jgi:hypothetical protein